MPQPSNHAMLAAVILIMATADSAFAAEEPRPSAPAGTEAAAPADPSAMRINDAGLQIIKDSEGLRLTAYQDGGQTLIGYGHSATAEPGKTITAAEAETLLREDVALCEGKVAEAVTVPVSANEFSAMVSLCYNIGWQPFTASNVVRKLNAADRPGAAEAFLLWNKVTVNGVKTVDARLDERRQKERALFQTP